jgi:hypothetical protein
MLAFALAMTAAGRVQAQQSRTAASRAPRMWYSNISLPASQQTSAWSPESTQHRYMSSAYRRMTQSINARPPYDPAGSLNRAPTGHASIYLNLGGYYPVTPPARRR